MKRLIIFISFIMMAHLTFGQVMFEPNYDESKAPNFKLPDPLKTFSGKKIKNIRSWGKNRRPEILDFFTQNVYGEVPGELEITASSILKECNDALNGKAKWANEQVVKAKRFEPVTRVSIQGEKFFINGKPTFEGRIWKAFSVEGLLPNSRMVQATFDDLNPETISKWNYPDTGTWDPDRNTDEFIAAMPEWKKYGLLAFTVNFQGGSPEGYTGNQPWENNAFKADGSLRTAFADRMERIVKAADEQGMIVILGIFYAAQDERLADENAVIKAVDNTVSWIQKNSFTNVMIEVANECNNIGYDHSIIKQERIDELIQRIKTKAPELLVSTSFNGNTITPDNLLKLSDFILLHGNGAHKPSQISEMVAQVRDLPSYKAMPIIFNEDDHFDFDRDENNFVAATKSYASWGYFDFRMKDEGFNEGYQSVPVNWGITSERKRGFFEKMKEIFVD